MPQLELLLLVSVGATKGANNTRIRTTRRNTPDINVTGSLKEACSSGFGQQAASGFARCCSAVVESCMAVLRPYFLIQMINRPLFTVPINYL